jgi:hypothetical protein
MFAYHLVIIAYHLVMFAYHLVIIAYHLVCYYFDKRKYNSMVIWVAIYHKNPPISQFLQIYLTK